MVYGYARVSTQNQNIERQIRNIREDYPSAIIYQEKYTGTKLEGRAEFNKLVQKVQKGDTIVFDEVSRMARSMSDGVKLYFELYEKGIDLIFLKENHINTSIYKDAISNQIEESGDKIADIYIEATNKVLKLIAKQQIEIAFTKAESEVIRLRERTKEGINTAKINGKHIGRPKKPKDEQSSNYTTKKYLNAKKLILKHNISFGGLVNDIDMINMCKLSRKTYYKYKKMIKKELEKNRLDTNIETLD